jgi:hypothetical protein
MITLSNKIYDTLKRFITIAFPAGITLYTTLAQLWNWGGTEKVILTASAVVTFLGVLLGVSSNNYKKEVDALFSDSQ